MNNFIKIFEKYNWKVDSLGGNNFIAYDDTVFVPFSINSDGTAAAVSYLICYKDDKDKFIEFWKNSTSSFKQRPGIGMYAFANHFCNKDGRFMQYGKICSHGYSCFEIEQQLDSFNIKDIAYHAME